MPPYSLMCSYEQHCRWDSLMRAYCSVTAIGMHAPVVFCRWQRCRNNRWSGSTACAATCALDQRWRGHLAHATTLLAAAVHAVNTGGANPGQHLLGRVVVSGQLDHAYASLLEAGIYGPMLSSAGSNAAGRSHAPVAACNAVNTQY